MALHAPPPLPIDDDERDPERKESLRTCHLDLNVYI